MSCDVCFVISLGLLKIVSAFKLQPHSLGSHEKFQGSEASVAPWTMIFLLVVLLHKLGPLLLTLFLRVHFAAPMTSLQSRSERVQSATR